MREHVAVCRCLRYLFRPQSLFPLKFIQEVTYKYLFSEIFARNVLCNAALGCLGYIKLCLPVSLVFIQKFGTPVLMPEVGQSMNNAREEALML